MDIARKVYDIWTENGTVEAGLADKFLDGRIDALAFLMWGGGNIDNGLEEVRRRRRRRRKRIEDRKEVFDALMVGTAKSQSSSSFALHRSSRQRAIERNPIHARIRTPITEPLATTFFSHLSQYLKVDRRNAEDLKYEEFVDEYLAPNEPCLIGSLLKGWPAYSELNSGGEVDIDYLEAMFGDASAPVHATTVAGDNFFGGVSKPITRSMTVMDYCSWWRR